PPRQPEHVAAREVRSGLFNRGDQQFSGVRRNDVVTVDEHEIVAGGVRDPRVAGRAQASIGLPDETETGVGVGELLSDGRAVVGRTVIHHDHFEIAVVLVRNRRQTLTEVRSDVIDRHYDAQYRAHGDPPDN